MCLNATVALWAAADPAPDPKPPLRFAIGRSPEVYQPDQNVVATRIGGWVDGSYQDSTDDSAKLSVNHFNVFLDSRYGEAWQLFFESEYEREPDLSGFEDEKELEIEQAYGRYLHSDALHLRLGKFNTPFGYWTPVHWSILMDTIEKPLHEGNRVIPEQQVGGELSGRVFPDGVFGRDAEIEYSAYFGYGDDTWMFKESDTDGFSFGTDLRLLLDQKHLFGLTLYQQDNDDLADRTERNVMLYGQSELPCKLTFRAEYLRQLRDRRPGLAENVDIVYGKVRWDFIDRAYFNYRYSLGDDDSTGNTNKHRIHTFTLGVKPIQPVRVKFEFSSHSFDEGRSDFDFWGVSVGYLF